MGQRCMIVPNTVLGDVVAFIPWGRNKRGEVISRQLHIEPGYYRVRAHQSLQAFKITISVSAAVSFLGSGPFGKSRLSIFPVRSCDGERPLIQPDSVFADAPSPGAFMNKAQFLHHPAGASVADEDFAKDALGAARAERLVDQCANRLGRVTFTMRINSKSIANIENPGVLIDRSQAHATNVSGRSSRNHGKIETEAEVQGAACEVLLPPLVKLLDLGRTIPENGIKDVGVDDRIEVALDLFWGWPGQKKTLGQD